MAELSRVVFSTGKDDWQTPPDLFAHLNAEFDFYRDAAALVCNRMVPFYYGPDHVVDYCRDGLAADWREGNYGAVWVNPPYSRGLQKQFIAKAAGERLNGVTTVMLLPARTDTQAFHQHIWCQETHQPREGVEVRFLKGRLKFVGAEASAPFPSMVIVFRGA